MPIADRMKSAMEFVGRPQFFGKRLEIGQQGRRLVVAGRVAALNFVLDFTPGTFTPAPERFEPGMTGFLDGVRLSLPFHGRLVRRGTLTGETDGVCAGAQFADGPLGGR